ncbi:MAG: TonB-dependent receptor [Zoogloeaceae bacterium]|jgi:iron complex outermembrane receptor protein|nr:TonB-dependent receptor [Zoogloeaceae bacterium]
MKNRTSKKTGSATSARHLRRRAVSVMGLVSLLAPGLAQAQEAGAPAATATSTELEAVTVTVRRRAEDSQRVPTSVSSVKGNDLEDKRITQVQDLQQVLPSANAAFMHTRVSSVAVRGIGSNPASEGLESSVGIYVDNVFYARPGMLAIDLVDLEQVDLLRGPQGTLFGKNTTGGVLSLTTRKPTFQPESSISLSAGNRGYYQALASFSGPLSDTLAARLSLARTHDDGWVKNTYNGHRNNSIDRDGFRAQALWKPSADFDLRVIADYNHENDSQGTMVPYAFGPAAPGKLTWTQEITGPGGWAPNPDPKEYKVSIDSDQQAKVHQDGLSAEANWHLSNGFEVTSITAWRDWIFRPKNDGDASTLDRTRNTGYNVNHHQFSQELRLASPKSETFDYVVGGYYYWQNITSGLFQDAGTVGLPAPFFKLRDYGESTTNSYSLFAQGNWHITPRLDLTAGLRGTYEIKEARVRRALPVAAAWDSGNLEVRDFSPSALASLSYRFTDRFMGYSLFSYGEKSGGINISGVNQGPQLGADSLKIDAEKATNFELGFKSEWLNRRLTVNSNIFLGKIKDYQTTGFEPLNNAPVTMLTNAGDAETYGLEFDLKARPVSGLSLSLNGSYNHARYTKFESAPCSAELQALGKANGTCDLSGKPLVGAPDWIVNLGGRYDWFVGEGVSQYLVANYAWRSEAEGFIDDSRFARIPSYGLLNLATGWQFGSGQNRWDISLWVRNALDKRYFLTALGGSASNGGGGYSASAGTPRTIGLTVKLDF